MNTILKNKFFFRAFVVSILVLLFYTCTGYSKPLFSSWFKSTSPSTTTPPPSSPSPSIPFYSQSKTLGTIKPHILDLVYKAHDKAIKMGLAKKSLVTIVDYTIPSTEPRLWVVDLNKKKVIFHTLVAHGSGNGGNLPTTFSDRPGSRQASLGVFVTGKTYQGGHGLSLVLHGLEQGINGNAERRRIVVHGANYVNPAISNELGRLGRSFGCLALENHLAKKIIQTIQDGSLVFSYYPDKIWLKNSKFL
jgi:hypothetical protein